MPLKIERCEGPATPWSLPLSTVAIGSPAAPTGTGNIANARASPILDRRNAAEKTLWAVSS